MNLKSAADAVRHESVERSTGHRATRGRVLESVGRSPRRRLHAVVAAVIASMFGASAFAWYARAPHTTPTPPPTLAQVAPAADPRDVGEPVQHTVRHEPPPPVAIEAIEPEPAPAHESPGAPQPSPRAPAAPVTAPAPAPVAAPARDATLELYATAHHLHFQQHDMTAALAAWDRYLAAAPDGTLAPEARFNRVVALVKLARWSEAAHALDALDPSFRPADLARLRDVIRQHSS